MKKSAFSPGKILMRILGILLILLFLLLAGAVFLWHNELFSIQSIHLEEERDDSREAGAVYSMHISGDYYFDDFLQQGGAKGDGELIDFITSKIAKGLIPMHIENSKIGCSAFTASTPQGERLFARNYDLKKTNTMVVFTDPGKGRHKSISTVDLKFLSIDPDTGITGLKDKILCLAAPYAPLDGVNDAGVSCGIFMSYQGEATVPTDMNTEKPDLTSTTMLRLILDYADSVEEAIDLVQQYDLHDSAQTSYHYMVADASGKSAVLEWVAGTDATDNDGGNRTLSVLFHEPTPEDNFQIVTNYILTPGYYEGVPEQEMHGFDRLLKLQTSLEEDQGVVKNEEKAMRLLASVGRRSWNNDPKNSITVHSVVYNLAQRTVYWVGNENYGVSEHHFVWLQMQP